MSGYPIRRYVAETFGGAICTCSDENSLLVFPWGDEVCVDPHIVCQKCGQYISYGQDPDDSELIARLQSLKWTT